MAVTPEQKASIRKRAEELVAGGMPAYLAAQQAYRETTGLPVPGTTGTSPLERAQDASELESRKTVQEIERARAKYVDEKADVLEKQGISNEVARSRAEKEFEETYLAPVVSPYGPPDKRLPSKPFGIDVEAAAPPSSVSRQPADLETALRPQTSLPETAVREERERAAKPPVSKIIGSGPDYNKLNDILIEQGLSAKEAANQIAAIQSAYNLNLGRQRASAERDKRKLPDDFVQKTWEATLAEIEGIPAALAKKKDYITDFKPEGPNDPLFLAFSKQLKAGEGVPKLTPGQGKYIASLAQSERSSVEKRLRDEYKDKPLDVTEEQAVEGLRGGGTRKVSRQLVGEEKEAKIREMAAEEITVPWWSDPAEVERRLKLGGAKEKGVFQEETAFGTQRESNLGWLVRSAMAPLNAVAGAVFPEIFTGTDPETKAAVEEARRRNRPQAYKDSPILLNIAEGRGFVGEAAEVSKITGLDTAKFLGLPADKLYVGGAFAMDMLDPSLDFAIAAKSGLQFGADVMKGARAAGMGRVAATRAGVLEGAKEFGKGIVFENPALNTMNELADALKLPKLAPGDVRIAIANRLANDAEATIGVGRSRTPNARALAESEILRNVDVKLKAMDQYITGTGTVPGGITGTEIRAAAGRAIAKDPRLAGPGGQIIPRLTTDDALYKATQREIIDNTIQRGVFKATKDSVLKSGIIAITRNLFATKDTAAKILNAYRKTPFAKTAREVASFKNYDYSPQTVVGQSGDRRVIVNDGYKTTLQQANDIGAEALRLQRRGLLNTEDYLDIRSSPTFISSKALRRIQDAGVEEVAAGFRTVRGTDIVELNPIVAKELLKPIELRDFGAPGLRNWIATSGGLKLPKQPLTAVQQAFADEVIAGVTRLDAKLRNDMNRMMNDAAFRSAYGVAGGKKLSREEAIGYLIVGPVGSPQKNIEETLKLISDEAFFQEKYINDILDIFSGIKLSQVTDVWTPKGRAELMALASAAATRLSANPATYYPEMMKLIEDAKGLLDSPDNLKVPKDEIRVPKTDNFFRKGTNSEALIASYYQAESARIIEEALQKIVRTGSTYVQTSDLLRVAGNAGIRTPAQVEEVVGRYLTKLLTDPTFATKSNVDRLSAIGLGGRTIDAVDISQLVAELEGYSRIIMRNNGFDPIRNPVDELTDVAKKALYSPSLEAQANAMLGKETVKQLREALAASSSKSIQMNLSRTISDSYKNPTVMGVLKKVYNNMLAAFYTLVLTLAPRFHGANIVGAPSLIYSTTGRLVNPKSFIESLSAISMADTALGGVTIVTDRAGRGYTANELFRTVGTTGGESVFAARLPGFEARTASAAADTSNIAGTLRRTADWLLSTPDKEDLAFRMSMAIDAIKEGRSIDEAQQLSRASLYDRGTIRADEERLQQLLLFYSFTRNNLINLVKNLIRPEGWRRIANVMKTKRGVESILVDPEERKYAPETAATRILLGKAATQAIGEKDVILATPSDSTLSAIELLLDLVAGDFVGALSGMMKPGQAFIFKETADSEFRTIPAEHIAVYQGLANITGSSVSEIASTLAGETIIPVRSDAADAIDGYAYPLLSEGARERYRTMINGLGYIGATRILNDYPNSWPFVDVAGTKSATAFQETPLGTAARIGMTVGAVTPLKTLTAEQQRLRALISQNAEGRKMVKQIDDIMLESELVTKPGDVEGIVERVERGKRRKAEGRLGISDLNREKLRLSAEIDELKMKIKLDPARERRNIYVDEIRKRADRITEINKDLKEARKNDNKTQPTTQNP